MKVKEKILTHGQIRILLQILLVAEQRNSYNVSNQFVEVIYLYNLFIF